MTAGTIFEVLFWALAVRAILEAWFYGSLFESARAWSERTKDPYYAGVPLWRRPDAWLAALLSCRLCLSYHVALWPLLPLWAVESRHWLWLLPFSLASVGVVHLLDGLYTADPGSHRTEEDDDDSEYHLTQEVQEDLLDSGGKNGSP